MSFDPKTNKYPYPEYTYQHYLELKKDNGLVFDENYPFIDKSKSFRFKQFLVRILLYVVVFPLAYIRLGLRIENRGIIKKYKNLISEGVISVANHVHMWDYIAVMCAIRPHKSSLLAWDKNIRGENATLIRMVGGIPIPPSSDLKASKKFMDSLKDLLDGGGWLHLYPEGCMWEYYRPIRPLKTGGSYFALKYQKPIIPLAFSYRRPSWIRRKIFKQIACFTLRVGEPIYPNGYNVESLTVKIHEELAKLAELSEEENMYPPVFNKSKRIDYYTDTYGVGYKGSW